MGITKADRLHLFPNRKASHPEAHSCTKRLFSPMDRCLGARTVLWLVRVLGLQEVQLQGRELALAGEPVTAQTLHTRQLHQSVTPRQLHTFS